jgi:hypothetical protein
MQRLGRIATLVVAVAAIGVLAFVYATGSPAPRRTVPADAPHAVANGGGLQLRLSPALGTGSAREDAAAARAVPLALGTAGLCAFATAFWAGAGLRRRRGRSARAPAPSVAIDAPAAPAPADETARDAAIAKLAVELEARETEVRQLRKEIEDWQDAWRLAKPRLTEQQHTIEHLNQELAAARSAVSGMRRYVAELQNARAGHAETRFAEEVDAWIARFMHAAPPAA